MSLSTILLCALSLLCVVNAILAVVSLRSRSRREGEKDSGQLVASALSDFRKSIESRFDAMELKSAQSQEGMRAAIERIRSDNARQMEASLQRIDRLTESVERNMQLIRKENTEQLERMRRTVDEQLKETLETRLSQSFEQVLKQLEAVYKGLGEMQNLAKSVGDLSRLFTNVKSRGVWGEIQAEAILDDILTKDQYVRNFKPRPRSPEVVEFAICLPGKTDDDNVYLPIDSKFPREDYENYVRAQEKGDVENVRLYQNALRNRVAQEAKSVSEKYIAPPRTTDFAILFLPTESLYAEILSMPGFAEELQQKYRVTIAGPTTLAALVNSLQMGFRTLAVEKRSHEVWKLFSQMRKQFGYFLGDLEAAGKSVGSAASRIEAVASRSAKISQKLESIELPEEDDKASLPLE
ncbi:MAG: DNA recombination protein RmuC [Spirochaetes bacterium]|uniref:DNA recombination protein RmuC n=1 Tax=Candidatus Aphodenecus pullistercoris TaxID=2840669 RepID=A0A9D9EA93_9SPIR|nr:DNA recombination protein RmuC [Candidatus Aphodenecus pullistercoris]